MLDYDRRWGAYRLKLNDDDLNDNSKLQTIIKIMKEAYQKRL